MTVVCPCKDDQFLNELPAALSRLRCQVWKYLTNSACTRQYLNVVLCKNWHGMDIGDAVPSIRSEKGQ